MIHLGHPWLYRVVMSHSWWTVSEAPLRSSWSSDTVSLSFQQARTVSITTLAAISVEREARLPNCSGGRMCCSSAARVIFAATMLLRIFPT